MSDRGFREAVSSDQKVCSPLRWPIRTSRPTHAACDVFRKRREPAFRKGFSTGRLASIIVSLQLLLVGSLAELMAASQYETQLLYFSGQYDECEQIARQEVARRVWNEMWPELLIECMLTRGQYEAARDVYEENLGRYADRIAYRLLGDTVYRFVNQPKEADEQLAAIVQLVRQSPWRYGSMRDQVTLGRFFQRQGEDGRQILELIYDRVRNQNPKYPEVYIATAELALAKQDRALASEQLGVAAELQPSNPNIAYLQALAWRDDAPQQAQIALRRALEINPRHLPSLLLQVDQLIDAEEYELAESQLEQVLAVNLREPKAWAYHAVIAHLRGHFEGEQALRRAALDAGSANPEVDHLIGLKLSQKYRFREGVAYQRQALKYQPNYVPAKFQLAHDLLRLGHEQEGWQLAADVQQQDNYHVVAYNLVTLKQQLERFQTLESEHFVVRMEAKEAKVYGELVINLLEEAHEQLCAKYDAELEGPVFVEIFPRQQDFAIRTFGLPGGSGYLGVCFGRLITANSPNSSGTTPTNWHSVLWHEFCHVVTLQKTQNRMPRWLSEGISVYEERQRDASWGQQMTPVFRRMILSDELTPISQLSGAFLQPPSPIHLQFAYYESSLAVEYLIEQYGIEVLRRILVDLSVGMPLDESLRRYTGSPGDLDQDFAVYARGRAEGLAPALDWQTLEIPDDAPRDLLVDLLRHHPMNYHLSMSAARQAIHAGEWSRARELLEPIQSVFPQDVSAGGATPALALVLRELGDVAAERRVLETWSQHDSAAVDALRRLIEIDTNAQEWGRVREFSQRIIAVNPMIIAAQQSLGMAAQHLNDPQALIQSQIALLENHPPDPAGTYYRLATAYQQLGKLERAKRYVLMALEEAPRYRDAQHLLLELTDSVAQNPTNAATEDDESATRLAPDPGPSVPPDDGRSPEEE